MLLTDVFSSASVAANRTEAISNRIPYLGTQFFPAQKKQGIDLQWIKSHKGLGVSLKPANFDALPTVRSREAFNVERTQMAFFRESMIVKESDMIELMRINDMNDPFLPTVLADIYDDTNRLLEGADIVAERMRMQLMATTAGVPKIVLEADNVKYEYNYDPDGSWKADHYLEVSGTSTWDKPTTAKPLTDIRTAKKALANIGVTAEYILMNSNTFEYLMDNDQIKGAILAQNATANIFMDDELLSDFLQRKTRLKLLIYDKMYTDYDGSQKYFFPDDYVAIIGNGELGKTWYGTTPEERTLVGNSSVDVTVMNTGVTIAVKTEAGPPVLHQTTASQIVLPSYEGMDKVYVMKVK